MPSPSAVKLYKTHDPNLSVLLENETKAEKTKYASVKTFFTNYKNPVGIEIEVENCKNHKGMDFWSCKQDQSLKISGVEFVSRPLSGKQIDFAIHEIASVLAKESPLWSHRTSIHVHTNVTTLTEAQLRAMCMLYGLYEDIFFLMVDKNRKGSAFCYPATSISPPVFLNVSATNKYCALNLEPMTRFGTVEFRHMHGTDDWRLVRRWVQLIVKLHKFAEDLNKDGAIEQVQDFIQKGLYLHTFKKIFGATAALFGDHEILQSCQNNVLWSLILSEQELN